MSSRKSSASFTKPVNNETVSNAELIVFQGNRFQQPDRQPKLPPPVERQKDEGFARFLKKHSSPTHNRVTAGGRIVPMEPRSPPAFTLPSIMTNRSHAIHGDHELRSSEQKEQNADIRPLQGGQQYDNVTYDTSPATSRMHVPTVQPVVNFGEVSVPTFLSSQPTQDLVHAPAHIAHASAPMLMPMRAYPLDQQMGGPVLPYATQSQSPSFNTYQNPSALHIAMHSPDRFGQSSTWAMYDQNYLPQGPANQVLPAFEMLAAWERHYIELDLQLKNIDRHRAMHHLNPHLADQRKVIVQQRSDAKDTIRDYQLMLGVRRTIESSQDSFTTGFNVDAPAYIPNKAFDTFDSASRDHFVEPTEWRTVAEKPKVSSARRAIPIVSPTEQKHAVVKSERGVQEAVSTQYMNDVDEWGVQNRPAPPEIQREQSQLSDMLQAEQQLLSDSPNDNIQHICRSQSFDQSQQGMPINGICEGTGSETRVAQTIRIEPASDTVPCDNADEIQQVMDAIAKPKGTTTQVRLLDSRVISVEGQGLDLSPNVRSAQPGPNHWSKADAKRLTSSNGQLSDHRMARKNGKVASRINLTNKSSGKENALVAPSGHQKAATDAFLAQYNTIEGSVALGTKSETQSLRTISNGRAEDCQHARLIPTNVTNLSVTGDNVKEIEESDEHATTKHSVHPMIHPDLAFAQTATLVTADDLNNKSYSSVSIQNVNAIGRLPQNLDGAADAQSQLAAAEKARSPRLKRRHGNNGGTWYGPYCRDVFERARSQANGNRSAGRHLP